MRYYPGVRMPDILTIEEFNAITKHLKEKIAHNGHDLTRRSMWTQLAIFRLGACCGIRPQEMPLLRIKDICLEGDYPCVLVRKEVAKTRKERRVPLWWDVDTFIDLGKIKARWEKEGLTEDDIFLRSQHGLPQKRYYKTWTGLMWKLFCSCQNRFLGGGLGKDKQHAPSCRVTRIKRPYVGRHTFASMALAAGKTIAEVRDAMGHSNIQTTSIYLHVPLVSKPTMGSIFRYKED